MLRFIGTKLQNPSRFRQRRGPWAHGAPLGGRRLLSAGRRVGTHWPLAAPSLSPWPRGARGPLGAEGSPETAGGVGGWAQGRSRASGEEDEALQFGLVFVESAPAQGGWRPAPRWLSQRPGGDGQLGTWQYFRGRGLRVGSARLGHQDGLLPDFQDVC